MRFVAAQWNPHTVCHCGGRSLHTDTVRYRRIPSAKTITYRHQRWRWAFVSHRLLVRASDVYNCMHGSTGGVELLGEKWWTLNFWTWTTATAYLSMIHHQRTRHDLFRSHRFIFLSPHSWTWQWNYRITFRPTVHFPKQLIFTWKLFK